MSEQSETVAATDEEEQPWFIRPKEAARLVSLDESTIRNAIYAGTLRARKFQARGWLIQRSELKRWIEDVSTANVKEPVTIPTFIIPSGMSDLAPLMNTLRAEEQAMRPEDI
jgi:DNA binding domain, excisionase family